MKLNFEIFKVKNFKYLLISFTFFLIKYLFRSLKINFIIYSIIIIIVCLITYFIILILVRDNCMRDSSGIIAAKVEAEKIIYKLMYYREWLQLSY